MSWRKLLSIILVSCLAAFAFAQHEGEKLAVTFIEEDAVWTYWDIETRPASGWMNPGFDDSGWGTGRAYLATKGETEGQGLTTVLAGDPVNPTYYFRKKFYIEDPKKIREMSFNIDYDDAYLVYFNGHQVASSNFKCKWGDHRALCKPYPHHSLIDNSPSSEPIAPRTDLSLDQLKYLRKGENTIAVAIKQGAARSTDATFMLTLYGSEAIDPWTSQMAFAAIVVTGSILAAAYFIFLRRSGTAIRKMPIPGTGAALTGSSSPLVKLSYGAVLLVNMLAKDHTEAVGAIMTRLVKGMEMGGVFVAVTAPSELIKEELESKGINCDDIHFVDCVSQMAYDTAKNKVKNTVFVENPSSLEEIIMQIDRQADEVASENKFVFVDSLTSLLIYNTSEAIREFTHRVINKERLKDMTGIFLTIRKREIEDLVTIITPMCDGRVDWEASENAVLSPDPEALPTHRFDPESKKEDIALFPGHSYLVLEDPGRSRAMNMFFNKLSSGQYRGLCISRDSPQSIASEFTTHGAKMIWLTDMAGSDQDSMASRPLDISVAIDDFTRGNENSLVLLDGLQYIITEYDFKTVLKLMANLKDRIVQSGSILLVPVISMSLKPMEIGLLESELEPIKPQ